jgi:hypothetical protein
MDIYSADKRRNQSDTCFGACNGLSKTEEEGKVAMDLVVSFQFSGSLNTLPSRGDFDKYAVLADAQGFIQGDQFFGLDAVQVVRRKMGSIREIFVPLL